MNSAEFTNLAVIIAIVALVSPIITSIVENLFKVLFKSMETKRIHQKEHNDFVRRVFENYICYAGKVINEPNHDTLAEYGSAFGLILFYVSDDESKEIIQCHRFIRSLEWSKANDSFEKVAVLIKNRLLTLYK